MKFYKGIAGKRQSKLKGVMLHNDAGSASATREFYGSWLKTRDATLGFAHAYVTSTGTLLLEDEANRAWHSGSSVGNNDYYSIEICQSKADKNIFIANELRAIKLAAEVLQRNGLKANADTVKFHREFYATECPHRSWELRGKNLAKVKAYYIAEINKFITPTKAPATPKVGRYQTTDNLNIRTGAGLNFRVKLNKEVSVDARTKTTSKNINDPATLRKGVNVDVLEIKKVGTMYWGRIPSGWVSMDYLKGVK
jgi:N-acetylmuramoyl-L-alanine amidase CwlA